MSDTAQSVHQQQSTNCCPKELHDEGGGIVPLAALVLVSTITPQRWSTIIVWSTDGNNNFPYENSPMLPQLHVEVVVVGGHRNESNPQTHYLQANVSPLTKMALC